MTSTALTYTSKRAHQLWTCGKVNVCMHVHASMCANRDNSRGFSFHATVAFWNTSVCVFAYVYFSIVVLHTEPLQLLLRVFNNLCKYACVHAKHRLALGVVLVAPCVCLYVCDSITLRMSVCTVYTVHQGRAGRLVRVFGGDFHIAWGHVGKVPTPGAVGARWGVGRLKRAHGATKGLV